MLLALSAALSQLTKYSTLSLRQLHNSKKKRNANSWKRQTPIPCSREAAEMGLLSELYSQIRHRVRTLENKYKDLHSSSAYNSIYFAKIVHVYATMTNPMWAISVILHVKHNCRATWWCCCACPLDGDSLKPDWRLRLWREAPHNSAETALLPNRW